MRRIALVVTALCGLIILPPIKEAYDAIMTDLLTPLAPSDFVLLFFTLLPYALLGLIVFGTIYKLFRPPPMEGQ